ncbi:hypothetical protein F5878DRAFT_727760 [Lentinula raphanica]|uniref:Uncharacterized protein n=1 Tax=Lentinula raphanica TaxID=153919 RepID=A0AA38P2T6_9AGAR|nr:hypothetical protein F5878DRAFT_727760 [Lentinula raphanica]
MVNLIVCQTRLLVFLVVFLPTILNIMVAALPFDPTWQAQVPGENPPWPIKPQPSPIWFVWVNTYLVRTLEGEKYALRATRPLQVNEKWQVYIGVARAFHAVQKEGQGKWKVAEIEKATLRGRAMQKLGKIERLESQSNSQDISRDITEGLSGIEGDNQFQALDNAMKFLRREGKSSKGLEMPETARFVVETGDPWNSFYSEMRVLLEKDSEQPAAKEPEPISSSTEFAGGGKKGPFEDVASDLPPPQRSKTGSNPALLPQGAVTVPKLSAKEEERTREAMSFRKILSSA